MCGGRGQGALLHRLAGGGQDQVWLFAALLAAGEAAGAGEIVEVAGPGRGSRGHGGLGQTRLFWGYGGWVAPLGAGNDGGLHSRGDGAADSGGGGGRARRWAAAVAAGGGAGGGRGLSAALLASEAGQRLGERVAGELLH